MSDLLLEPLRFGFFQRGLLAIVIVACVCGVVGAYVVLRNLAFLGDALGHAVLPGLVVALLLGLNPLLGAAVAGVLFVVLVYTLSSRQHIRDDSAIGIFFVGAFALGLLLLSRTSSATRGLSELLFGSVLAVRPADLWLTAGAGALLLLTIWLCYKELLITVFDPALGAALGLPVRRFELLLLLLVACAVIVSLQTIGNVLVVALLVTPTATARLLTHSLPAIMGLAALIGSLCGLVGLYLSYYTGLASGGMIVLLTALCFTLALLLAPERGLVWRWARRASPTTEAANA
jgi:ABC-type Mn2+/Zn2+ transport system permease subunit